MADPRDGVTYRQINAEYAMYEIDDSTITYDATAVGGSAQVRKAVKLIGSHKIALTTDGSEVEGVLEHVEWDNMGRVQISGFMELPGGNGASLTPGKKVVGAVNAQSAGGYIRECGAQAGEYVVARGRIVDADVTTAVWVVF